MIFDIILLQIGVDGFKEAAEISPLMSVLVSTTIILAGVVVYLFRVNLNRNREIFKLQSTSSDKIVNISEQHINKLEKIRQEIVAKDEKRTNDMKETEKEILSILNGLSQILELGQAKSKSENHLIHSKLNDVNEKLNTIIDGMIRKK